MGVSVTVKKRVKPKLEKPKATEQVDVGAILADEYGTNAARTKKLMENPAFNEFKETCDKLKNHLRANFQPLDEPVLRGAEFKLEIGKCRKVPAGLKEGAVAQVKEMVGEDVFMKLVHLKLEDLRAYLTPEQLAEVLVEGTEYTETRAINVITL